jgi:CelD/BcsL family acetyltransferase involved in cellulose biosynthesis
MFTYRKIDSLQDWDALRDVWNNLAADGVISSPFIRHELLRAWWVGLGGGEWSEAGLSIYTGWQGSELIGAAPFFSQRQVGGKRRLLLIGSFEIMDYLDLIVSPRNHRAFLSGLLDHLAAGEDIAGVWLYNLLDASPTYINGPAIAAEQGWQSEQELLQPAPRIELPGNFEEYLAGIDKKQRHEIRRKMRRLEHSGHMHRWFIVEHAEALEEEISAFLHMMALDENKKAFLTPAMSQQMRSLMKAAFHSGLLHLSFLEIDGIRSAAYLSFRYDNQLFVYNSGVNPQQFEFSPGWVLLGDLLEWANEQGLRYFDFMRGSEDYKYKFGAVSRTVNLVKLTPPARG